MRRTTTTIATTAAIGAAALLLSGCSVFGGDDPLPKPTSQTTSTPKANRDADRFGGSGGATSQVASQQTVPAGTVVATTDAVSKSGDTRIHVEVVARKDGRFDAELSGYRTTEPQPMTIEFRRTAAFNDGDDSGAVGSTTWTADEEPPSTISLFDAGSAPDWLHDVVLTPAPSGGDDSARPWVGSVLAIGTLRWELPADSIPKTTVTLGTARPGAYGYVFDAKGTRITGSTGTAASYQVAHGDDQVTVAKRFGISVAALRWLNPTMQVQDNGWIYEDTTLNLDPAAR